MTFANPYVWVDGTLEKLSDLNGKSGTYDYNRQVEAGKTVTAPEASKFIPVTNDSGVSLKLAGWYLENGEKWNFDTYAVNSNFTLYPVWEEVVTDVSGGDVSGGDAGSTAAKKYWPVIFRGAVWGGGWNSGWNGGWNGGDLCVCLPEGTKDMPKKDLSGGTIGGWEKFYENETGTKKIWEPSVDSVKGVTVLKVYEASQEASASPEPSESPEPSASPAPEN